ncbi:MAG: alpha/beta fold hydrolase [Bacteroidota bacterium]
MRPPTLLLHGFLGCGADWDAVRAHLPASWDVRAPDLPGFGEAVGLPEAAYTMDGAADRLGASVGGKADVVGYSMGGRLALFFALRHPGRVRRLVLVSASPGLRTEAERADRRRLDAERAAALAANPEAFHRDWVQMPLFESLDPALRDRLVADRLAHVDPTEAGRSLRGMGTGAQPSLWTGLSRIPTPAWAVAGALDSKFVRLAREMAASGPITPVVFPEAGHALPAEAPAALAALLTDFLSDG